MLYMLNVFSNKNHNRNINKVPKFGKYIGILLILLLTVTNNYHDLCLCEINVNSDRVTKKECVHVRLFK